MFDKTSTGQFSLRKVSEYLYSKGARARSGKRFSNAQTHRILTNPSYYGYFRFKGELYRGNYEPIISKTMFDAAQKGLKDRSKPSVNTWDSTSYNGLFKCPTCGCAITTTVKIKKYKKTNRTAQYVYLHCTKRKDECSQPPISLGKFEDRLLKSITRISIDEEVWNLGMELLKEKNKEEVTKTGKHLKKLNDEYDRLRLKLNNLVDMRANFEITPDEFKVYKNLCLEEQAKVEGIIQDAKLSANNWIELAEEFLNNAYYAQNVLLGDNITDKRNLLMDLGENFLLDDKNIVFSFKKPYDVLLKPQYRTDGRDRRESNPPLVRDRDMF